MPVESNGLIVGRYRIEGKLGQGGMGAVYRAFDLHLELPCALKQLGLAHLPTEEVTRRQRTAGKPRLTREVAAEQFRQEARLLARLEHPGLPRVTDCFAVGDDHYLVMTLVEGEDLEEALARAATGFPEPEVLAWVVQVMDALDYCHAQGVIHRDVKPANIIVTAAGKVYLVDFGIAKLAGLTQLTPIGARAATTGYSPIEQYTGHEHTGVCSDIYALGATMYALLTGQAPRAAGLRVAGGDMPSPRALAPGVSVKMDAVV
ncbi:MAG TPA: serine/threonine-protein kinase, partial [Anaerolineae bacterium]|nr:serine/threonine-protein kinase [Anaerolineae bacterium]